MSATAPAASTAQHSDVRKFALAAAEMAANTRCENVVILDLRGRSPVTEFFIIATGTSPRQMRTVVDELRDLGKKMGFAAWHMNGYESARWIVLDCVHVVAHVFESDARDYYDLELLWGDSPRIDWRKELGLPPAPATEKPPTARSRFAQSAGMDEMDAEEEEARLEGRDPEAEEGDADVDEDADIDAPIVMELPDESTGSNSVQFVEIDPPSKRRQRGRAVYPTPIEEQEDTTEEERGMGAMRRSAVESLDEDDQQRAAESEADKDVEAVSKETLPRSKQRRKPMGGVSAGISSTSITGSGEEDQTRSRDDDDRVHGHRDEIPEAHETAAEATRIGNVLMTTEQPGQRSKSRALKTRKDLKAPTQSAPTATNPKKAKAGVVKSAKPTRTKAKITKKSKPAAKSKPTKKPKAKAPTKKPAAKRKKKS